MNISRRNFFHLLGAGATTALLGDSLKQAYASDSINKLSISNKFGNLIPDAKGIIDLPQGWRYKILSSVGETMNDGFKVPNHHDGMGAFPGANGSTVLVRNHELSPLQKRNELPNTIAQYDFVCSGCTTNLVVSEDRFLQKHYLSLAGTNRNCSGGTTPWGSWISCEEDISTPYPPPGYNLEQILSVWGRVQRKHGYNFEVPITGKVVEPVPLRAMGRFRHEAIAIDSHTGYVYQTEDRPDGCFYRFRPYQVGNLSAGGILEALAIENSPAIDTGYNFPVHRLLSVRWTRLKDVDPKHDTLRYEAHSSGAAIFRRGEGMCLSDGQVYFTCTSGGQAQVGQIFRYDPRKETVELFMESSGTQELDYPDNLTLAPFGDLVICEDGRGEQRLIGITPTGNRYVLARNAINNSEFAGVCFASDGQTMFVNIYNPGMTLAIWGF